MYEKSLAGEARTSCLTRSTMAGGLDDRDDWPGYGVPYDLCGIRTCEPRMIRVLEQARRFASLNELVLIEGETGSGKEVLASAIHALSDRSGKSLVTIDCGALPENLIEAELFGHERGAFTGADRQYGGRVEAAAGGTLFIDEVNSVPLSTQATLLRLLDRHQFFRIGRPGPVEVDVRVIAASNVPLKSLVASGRMRADFFHRLDVLRLSIPPLRERLDDVPLLALAFLAEDSLAQRWGVKRISDEVMMQLHAYHWPGNVRELLNLLRRSVVFGTRDGVLESLDFPTDGGPGPDTPQPEPVVAKPASFRAWMRERERDYLKELLRCHRTMSARALVSGIPERTLYRKLRALCG